MALALQIALGGLSCVFLISLIRRAFFVRPAGEPIPRFEVVDVVVALLISGVFIGLAFLLFSQPQPALREENIPDSVISQAMVGAMVLGYVGIRRFSIRRFLGVDEVPVWKLMGLGIFLMLGSFPVIGMLTSLLQLEAGQEQEAVKFFRKTDSLQARWLLVFMAVIVAPVVEELVFRGLIYRVLKSYFGRIASMFFTSVLFAAIHGNVPILLPLVLLAFALTAGLELSGSLLVSMAMHATFNAISLGFIYTESLR